MKNLDFMPENYEMLRTQKNYLRLSQLKEGDSKFRIVMRPISGWLDWENSKPRRYRPDAKPSKSFDESKPIKCFWTFYVWSYEKEDLFIMEVTQTGVIKSLMSLAKDEDWGSWLEYDLKIVKTGSGKDTEYQVTPLPHKPASEMILKALERSPVNLEALYTGGDPWLNFDPLKSKLEASSVTNEDVAAQIYIKSDDVDLLTIQARLLMEMDVPQSETYLMSYLETCHAEAPKFGKNFADIVNGWLNNPKKFLEVYRKWVTKRQIEKNSLQTA